MTRITAMAKEKKETTLFISASANGNIELVREFLKKGIRVDEQVTNGKTALMAAIDNGHTGTAKFLLENGAQDKDKEGWSPLIYASYHGLTEIAKLLLEKGAQIDLQRNNGWSDILKQSNCYLKRVLKSI